MKTPPLGAILVVVLVVALVIEDVVPKEKGPTVARISDDG
jgi:hypothetical protein